jgi:hypothetical protein
VALSRLRSLNGLVLLSPLQVNGISNDEDVMEYATHKASEEIINHTLQQETKNYIHQYLKNSFDWAELAQEWRNHKFSYLDSDVSAKSKHKNWAANQLELCDSILVSSSKFMNQLDHLFYKEEVDFDFVNTRIQAAFLYFFEKLDALLYQILYKIEEVKRMKQMKQFYDELQTIEELQTNTVLRLMKAKKMIETIVEKRPIEKVSLHSQAIKSYKINKLERVFEDYKNNNQALISVEEDDNLYLPKKKKTDKTAKKPTTQITYEMWVENNSIEEIVQLRKLSHATILGHFTKLIKDKAVAISDIMPQDKIEILTQEFEQYTEESVTPLKEKLGDAFTWDELKMFKASL